MLKMPTKQCRRIEIECIYQQEMVKNNEKISNLAKREI